MNKKHSKTANSPTIEEIGELAEQGHDVSEHFAGQHTVKQFVSMDFPLDMLHAIVISSHHATMSRKPRQRYWLR